MLPPIFVVRGSDSGRVSFGLPGALPGRLLSNV